MPGFWSLRICQQSQVTEWGMEVFRLKEFLTLVTAVLGRLWVALNNWSNIRPGPVAHPAQQATVLQRAAACTRVWLPEFLLTAQPPCRQPLVTETSSLSRHRWSQEQ